MPKTTGLRLVKRSALTSDERFNAISGIRLDALIGFGRSSHWLSITDGNMIDESLIRVVENCHNLKSVKLSGCSCITDRSISKLAEECPHLVKLDMDGIYRITDIYINSSSIEMF
jgi:hypothetical protein